MAIYRDRVVPRLINWTCATSGFAPWRAQVCAGLTGRTVEVGFGSGLNIAFYPLDVTRIFAVEPAKLASKLAARRVATSRVPIDYVGLNGETLPLGNDSCESALITFTLCTIPNAPRALSELLRVLRPGGQLHFLEHGLAPQGPTAQWQRRLEPLQRTLADGCHLTRNPLALVKEAGFDVLWSEQRFARGPKPWSYFSVGVAEKPRTAPRD